jgi:hypothetical protein
MVNDHCQECEHANDLKGCTLKHISKARELLASGDTAGADHQLRCAETHLKKI